MVYNIYYYCIGFNLAFFALPIIVHKFSYFQMDILKNKFNRNPISDTISYEEYSKLENTRSNAKKR